MQDAMWIGRTSEDDFDNHSEAKMGGEPGLTGRANLFDMRKTSLKGGYLGKE
jgi:hypothetical protein